MEMDTENKPSDTRGQSDTRKQTEDRNNNEEIQDVTQGTTEHVNNGEFKEQEDYQEVTEESNTNNNNNNSSNSEDSIVTRPEDAKDSVKDETKEDETDADIEKDGDEEDEDCLGEEEENVEEEEEEETEMTEEEKEEMYTCVCNDDTAGFFNALDKPNADINMTWFNENLLMSALRSDQIRMVELLIDIGIDVNYEIDLVDLKDSEKLGKRMDCYRKSCRQIAYEMGLEHIVDMIDLTNENWFPYKKKTERTPYIRRPLPPPVPRYPGQEDEEEENDEELLDEEEISEDKDKNRDKESKKKTDDVDSGNETGKDNENSTVLTLDLIQDMIRKFEGNDEGYETMTPRSSPYYLLPAPETFHEERFTLPYKNTKASIYLRRHNDKLICERERNYSNSAKERSKPLRRVRRIDAVGSYERESRLWQSNVVQTQSVESIPYLARVEQNRSPISKRAASAVTTNTRLPRPKQLRQRPLTTPSMSTQISRILGESPLLRSQTELGLPSIRATQKRHPLIRSTTINPWCHANSCSVHKTLSEVKIRKTVQDPKFKINNQLYSPGKTFITG